jgi:hypothetical protein
MRPLTALLAILTGSAVALASGLILTWVTTLFLTQNEARFAPEQLPLLKAVAVFTLFAAASSGALLGELKQRRWRYQAYLATLLMFGVAVWLYWPAR